MKNTTEFVKRRREQCFPDWKIEGGTYETSWDVKYFSHELVDIERISKGNTS